MSQDQLNVQLTDSSAPAHVRPEEVEPDLLFALARARVDADLPAARQLALRARSNAEAMKYAPEHIQRFDDWLAFHAAKK